MAKELVNITKPFTLTVVRDGQLVKIPVAAGIQKIDADLVDHWYVKAHKASLPEGVVLAPAGDDDQGSDEGSADGQDADSPDPDAEGGGKKVVKRGVKTEDDGKK
jgi:hypothetical protein